MEHGAALAGARSVAWRRGLQGQCASPGQRPRQDGQAVVAVVAVLGFAQKIPSKDFLKKNRSSTEMQ